MLAFHRVPAVLAFLVLAGGWARSRADETVPGGWSSEVDGQSFSLPGETGNHGFTYGAPGNGLVPASMILNPGFSPAPIALSPQLRQPPQTFNALIPLGASLGKQVRKRPRR